MERGFFCFRVVGSEVQLPVSGNQDHRQDWEQNLSFSH